MKKIILLLASSNVHEYEPELQCSRGNH